MFTRWLPRDCSHAQRTPFVAGKSATPPFRRGNFTRLRNEIHVATLGILAYALVSPKAGEGIDARAFAAKTAARLRTYS